MRSSFWWLALVLAALGILGYPLHGRRLAAAALALSFCQLQQVEVLAENGHVKGMGELGMVGIPAAIANAVFRATGRRIRDLPITPDKLL